MQLTDSTILITGGAGFIGSNLCEYFLQQKNKVVCLDNFSTGKRENIEPLLSHPSFVLIEGDIRDYDVCEKAVKGIDYVFHEAALGSVPRSINDPITSNSVNVDGFLNMLVASRNAHIKRFIYAASSSTYGDSKQLPKVEENIGKPLSPYAVTKYVNELYADVFSKTYGMECIGLRYFNVFGRRQDPDGMYAAVIPLWIGKLLKGERPVINGDGSFSRDFTYIDNVIQANEKAAIISSEEIKFNAEQYKKKYSLEEVDYVFNIAYGENTTLNQLYTVLKENLCLFAPYVSHIEPLYAQPRVGDIPHSIASIKKSEYILGYKPLFSASEGFKLACEWYWKRINDNLSDS